MAAAEPLLVGLRRVKPAYGTCPFPWDVNSWMGISGHHIDVSARVTQAILELDGFADQWPDADELEFRLAEGFHPLTRPLLGLDFDSRRQRLRAAVARANQAAWRYADCFCDWQDGWKGARKTILAIRDFDNTWRMEIEALAHVRDKTSWGIESRSQVLSALEALSDFTDDTQAWATGAEEMLDRFTSNAPRLFLYLRICEIFTCFSGRVPPLHVSGKLSKNTLAPDAEFKSFMEAALAAIAFPLSVGGLDGVLRDIGKYVTGHNALKRLSIETNRIAERSIDYAYFPTVGLLNGLNCFSDDEL